MNRTTRKFGSYYGLRLTLFIDVDDYTGLLAQSVGARVMVHNMDESPQFDQALYAAPGEQTMIAVRRRDYERLPPPYTTRCAWVMPEQYVQYVADPNSYTQHGCRQACTDLQLNNTCGCVQSAQGYRNCDVFMRADLNCMRKIYDMVADGEISCDCSLPCRNTDYFTT